MTEHWKWLKFWKAVEGLLIQGRKSCTEDWYVHTFCSELMYSLCWTKRQYWIKMMEKMTMTNDIIDNDWWPWRWRQMSLKIWWCFNDGLAVTINDVPLATKRTFTLYKRSLFWGRKDWRWCKANWIKISLWKLSTFIKLTRQHEFLHWGVEWWGELKLFIICYHGTYFWYFITCK